MDRAPAVGAAKRAKVYRVTFLRLPRRASLPATGTPMAPWQPDNARILRFSAPAPDFSEFVRQIIRTLMTEGCPDIGRAAELAGISVRTLQRRLTQVGAVYSQLVDQVRCEMALHLLAEPEFNLLDIALELGYSDAANFTRAFRRWTGVTPSQFRPELWVMERHSLADAALR